MRAISFLCLFLYSLFAFSDALLAQPTIPPLERTLSISFQNERIDEALKKISQQTGVVFSYSASVFNSQKEITFRFENKTIREILQHIFPSQVGYIQKGNYIILTKKKPEQEIVVSGYVVDEATGKKLKEASIYDPVSLRSTVTDDFGFFELEMPKPSQEEMKLAIKKYNYTDTLVMVSSKRSSFQQIGLKFDKQKWSAFSDNLNNKLEHAWSWTKRSAQQINMTNIRDTLHRTWQVSFIPFVGTNHKLSGNVINNYSLNILGGYSRGTRKAELGGLFNINRQDVGVVQMAGLFNLNGGKTIGAQFAGLFNANLDSTEAAQFAGLANFNTRTSTGVQFAGLINTTVGFYRGSQFAGLSNFVTHSINGVQVAGLFNITPHTTGGTQVAGLFNVSGKVIKGSQVAGLINVAKEVKGTQVGFVNISDTVRGVPVGFLSFVKKGYHKIELAGDEIFPTNVSLRTGVRQFYNIVSVGVRPEKTDTTIWSFGYGLGSAPKINNKLFLNVDVTSNQIVKGNIEALNLINKLYLGFDFQLAKRFSITAGGTLNFRVYDAAFNNHATLFTYYSAPIIREGTFSKNTNYQLWGGAKVGVRFL